MCVHLAFEPDAKEVGPFSRRLHQVIGWNVDKRIRLKAPTYAAGANTGVAGGLYIHAAIANHPGVGGPGGSFALQPGDACRVRLLFPGNCRRHRFEKSLRQAPERR